MYKFYNINPRYKREPDCVINTIGGALGLDWQTTYKEMVEHCIPLYMQHSGSRGIESYLKSKGYIKQRMLRHKDNTKYTVKQFAKEFNKGTYVLSVANHLTFIKDGILYDTWDCGYKSVGNWWKI